MLDKKYPEEHKLITAAVSAYVFKDANYNPIPKLDQGWADYMDAFYIMVNIHLVAFT
jgi:chitinase